MVSGPLSSRDMLKTGKEVRYCVTETEFDITCNVVDLMAITATVQQQQSVVWRRRWTIIRTVLCGIFYVRIKICVSHSSLQQ